MKKLTEHIIQKQDPEKCTFHGWCFENKGHLNNQMLRLGCCLSPPIKIPAYVPGLEGFLLESSALSFCIVLLKSLLIALESHLISSEASQCVCHKSLCKCAK